MIKTIEETPAAMTVKKNKELTVIVALASFGLSFDAIADILQTDVKEIADKLFFEEDERKQQKLTEFGETLSSDLFKFINRLYETIEIFEDHPLLSFQKAKNDVD